MAKSYRVTAPLVVLRLQDDPERGDGVRVHLYEGAPVPAEADKDHLKMLIDEGFVAEVEAPAETDDGDPKPDSVDGVLLAVGDDPEKAKVALEEEKAGKNRKTLVEPLETLAAKG